ncbi:MAG: D-alanyl-D-alanine-carboxypeptidase/D-alanyl-D-alanine-endopeptidase [Vicingaceae bacterium]|jgi:CubicO group peptidase (beta-lactamase class C family)/transcriptional regulator with XRE-family HTH domain
MNNRSLAERLKYYRKSKGLSQEELSNKTNVTVRTIQRIEKAEVNPHLNTIKLLAVALNIEVSELLPLQNPKEETIKKKWLLLLHATPLLGIFIPLCNVLLPLFIWIHKREDNPVYNEHGVKVINFQITVLLLASLAFASLLTVEKWGFIIFLTTVPICIAVVIFNIIYVLQKEKCYYPFSIPFLKYKQVSSILLLTMLAFSSCATKDKEEIERVNGSTISKDSITRKINQLISDADVTGLSVSIFNNNKVVYQKAFGYQDADTKGTLNTNSIFYGASLSKAVFSLLVMQLVEKGIIDLDTPLQDYLEKPLPEYEFNRNWRGYSDLKGDKRYERITARMCLSHTTGFPNWRFLTKGGFDISGKLYFQFEPGTRYSYSGEGFSLLQFIVEKLTGKGLEEIAQERIFQPLGMERTSYIYILRDEFKNQYVYGNDKNQKALPFDQTDEAGAAGSLGTTLEDYSKFIEAVMNQKLMNKESFDKMFKNQISINSKQQFGPNALVETNENKDINLRYGLGWGLLQSPFGYGAFKEGHAEGFQHYSIIFPEKRIGILILSNSDNGESIFKELLEISIGDTYTPWEWENYTPYNNKPLE